MAPKRLHPFLISGTLALGAVQACAQDAKDYPGRPIRLVVPYSTGGTTDFTARVLGARLTEVLGQSVVVDNRAGAGSIVGTEVVAKANPDGHTLLMVDTGFSITPALYAKLPFDPRKDFAPVTQAIRVANWLIVHPALPKTVKELVALAKAKPGTLTFGSGGVGSPFHMAGEQFKLAAQMNIVHVPYKGGGPVVTDLIGGQISLAFPTMTVAHPHIVSGRLRALAVIAAKRSPALPEIPTMSEAGYPSVTLTSWYGVLAPAKTPKPIIDKLHAELSKIVNSAEVKERMAAQFAETIGSTPTAFGRLITDEIATWSAVAKAGGIKPE